MTTTSLFNRADRSAPPFTTLAATLTGDLVLPGDPDWTGASAAWNLAVPQAPAAVVRAAGVDDVVAAVQFALAHTLRVTAQPGGHGASTAIDGAILIRTGALDEIWLDAEAGTARVGSGVKWAQLLDELDGTGFIAPCGSSADVTVTGFCLSGGMSWFSRSAGLGAASIRAVEIVDGAGRRRWVDDERDPALIWALRGGGGDFAIVTALELSLTRAPELAGGRLMFPAEQTREVWLAVADLVSQAPDELTVFTSLVHFPPIPQLPEQIRGRSFCVVDAVLRGEHARLESHLAGVRAAGTVLRSTVRPLVPSELGTVCEEPVEPSPAVDGSTSLSRFDETTIDAILAAAGDPRCGVMQVQVRQLGGAFARPSVRPAAADGVGAAFAVFALAMAPTPESVPGARHAVDRALAALHQWRAGPLTLSMLGGSARAAEAFSPQVLARLRKVKASSDPRRVFVSNRPV